VGGDLLGDDLLGAVGAEADDAAAGVGRPEGAVALSQNAFGALQAFADVVQFGCVDAEIENRISHGYCSNLLSRLGVSFNRVVAGAEHGTDLAGAVDDAG